MSDTENESLSSLRLDTRAGTLRKKQSLYFQKGFEINFKETQDLRSTVAKKLKNATLKRGDTRNNSIFSVKSRNNSIYKKGTLEHRLHSMVDIAHLEFQDYGPDEEEYERQKEKHNQDKQYYEELSKDPTFSKYHKKCERKAKHELEKFYEEAERELEEIENLLGLDENSLLEIEKDIKSRMEEEALKEDIPPKEEEMEETVPAKVEVKEETNTTKDV